MLLFPRLLHSEASELARERSHLSIDELRVRSDTTHPATVFAPTGGTRVRPPRLAALQKGIRQIASANGYPGDLDLARQQQFDADAAVALKTRMEISASEASHVGVWTFLGCVLLPDVVRWRYPGGDSGTTHERFIGGSRGIRNTFGRLWWRAHLLGTEGDFSLLHELGEDELVQITERPVLAGNAQVAGLFAWRFLDYAREFDELSRSDFMRDAIKRLRRLLSFLALELLSSAQLREVVDGVLGDAAAALGVAAGRVGSVASIARPGSMEADPIPGIATAPVEPADQTAELEETFELGEASPSIDDLAAKLKAVGLEVVDRRGSGGCLWIVDQPDLKPVIDLLADHGYEFSLAKNGSRSTDGRKAWYLPADPSIDEESEHATAGDLQRIDLWERGEFAGTMLMPDFRVRLKDGNVEVLSDGNEASRIGWRLYEADEELRSRLHNLAQLGREATLLAMVAAIFLHQQEFLEQGRTALHALTLRQVADYIGIHESTVSRGKSDVYVETPAGLLPLGFFFSAGVHHRSGREMSARAVRAHLREIIESEPPQAPFSDEEIAEQLVGRGFSIARRTVAKYRDILGIPGALSRRRLTEEAG